MNEKMKVRALNVLLALSSAIKSLRLYPSNSVIVDDIMNKLHAAFLVYFELQKSLTISEADKKILIGGEPLSYKEHEKPQIMSLLEILLKFSLKSMTFQKGVERWELMTFLDYIAKNPEGMEGAGGLADIVSEKKLSRILLDERVFVARRKRGQRLGGSDLTDEELIELLGLAQLGALKKNRQYLQEMARNPDSLLESFETGVSRLMAERETFSKIQLAEKLIKMMSLMDKATSELDPGGQSRILQGVESSIARIDPDVAREIISQNTAEDLFAGMLSKYIAREFGQRVSAGPAPLVIGDFDEAQEMDDAARGIVSEVSEKDEEIHDGISMKAPSLDGKRSLLDKASIDDLLNIAEKLVAQKGQKEIETTIRRLLKNMFADETVLRGEAAATMVEIVESLSDENRIEFIEKISEHLLAWIRLQTSVTPAYKKICRLLGNLVRHFIKQGDLVKAIPILDGFNHIRTDNPDHNDMIHEEAADFIRALTSTENLDILFKIFNTGEQKKRGRAGELLMLLGDDALTRMLDLLREQTDSDERVRIMRLVIDFGQKALPFVHARINPDESWYYLRNLAYILGHIGNEASARLLQPLLLHENNKVRLEALKSIGRIGGKEMCPLIFSVVPQAEHNFILNIVDFLANKKCTDSVSALVDLFETSPVKDKSLRAEMEEKICNALGIIRSPEAIPFLARVAESKSFLGISRYSERVKIAATRALAAISNR